ncbi:MAG TPA: histidine kinase [Bacteroidia bacterium]|nr:histidine kinase [Bacteroidia bacterium]
MTAQKQFTRVTSFSLHLLLWGMMYLFWIFIFGNRTLSVSRTMTIEFCYLVFIALAFYLIVYLLIPRLLVKKKHILFFLFSFLIIASSAFFRALTALFISRHFSTAGNVNPDFETLYFNSLINIFFWVEGFVAIWIITDRIRYQRYIASMEKEKIETELKFLKAQNNPHFLFNSLNSIYFQIDKNNSAARETLMKFSEMLRYQLYDCSSERIPIEKEIHYLKNYISLQQLRMNDNYTISVSGEDVAGFSIAPLLILPVVENAFKHVSHKAGKNNEIGIIFSNQKNEFRCVVKNTKENLLHAEHSSRKGIGLENVRRRLELLYPGKHTLEIEDGNDYFTVTLLLKTDEDQMYHR